MADSADGGLLTLVGYVGTIIVTALVTAATGAWKARGIQASLDKRIDDEVANLRSETLQRQDEGMRQIGEGLSALRQKATDMELWNRDNFVRRNEFQNAVDGFTRSIDSLRADIKGEYARLNDKLDRVIQGKDSS